MWQRGWGLETSSSNIRKDEKIQAISRQCLRSPDKIPAYTCTICQNLNGLCYLGSVAVPVICIDYREAAMNADTGDNHGGRRKNNLKIKHEEWTRIEISSTVVQVSNAGDSSFETKHSSTYQSWPLCCAWAMASCVTCEQSTGKGKSDAVQLTI